MLGALLSASTIWWGINPHDEGLMLQAGARISDGQLPYRDFYANYGPGQYYLLGGLDLVFGPSLLSWRVLRVALDAGVAVLAYALTRREAPEWLALTAWLAVAAAMSSPSIPHPNPTALALSLGALCLARRSPTGAGALAGVAVVFRLDLGLAALAGCTLAAGLTGRRRASLGAALTGALVAIALHAPILAAAAEPFWDQTLAFALDEQRLQRLPLPGAYEGGFEPNKLLQHYFPYVLLGGTALWVLLAALGRAPLRLWAAAPLAAAGVVYLLARADRYHFIPLAAVLPILLAGTAARERRPLLSWALVAVIALIALHGLDQKRIPLLDPPALAELETDAADGIQAEATEARALSELAGYVRARVAPEQSIFVANPRHDLVKAGNPLVYVLLERPNPTRYDVMQPGVVTTAAVQREIVRDLEQASPGIVVRWLDPVASDREPNGAGRSTGVRILDRYLRSHYDEIRRFGLYAVLRRSAQTGT